MADINIPLKDVADKLNSISWDILDMLSVNEQLTYKDIRDALGGKQDKTNKEIARLEGALLIGSKKDDGDERKKIFTLSQNGKNILILKMKGEKLNA